MSLTGCRSSRQYASTLSLASAGDTFPGRKPACKLGWTLASVFRAADDALLGACFQRATTGAGTSRSSIFIAAPRSRLGSDGARQPTRRRLLPLIDRV